MDTERFVNEQNIDRYRKLVDGALTSAEKRVLLALLAEEERKLIALEKARAAQAAAHSARRPGKVSGLAADRADQ